MRTSPECRLHEAYGPVVCTASDPLLRCFTTSSSNTGEIFAMIASNKSGSKRHHPSPSSSARTILTPSTASAATCPLLTGPEFPPVQTRHFSWYYFLPSCPSPICSLGVPFPLPTLQWFSSYPLPRHVVSVAVSRIPHPYSVRPVTY